MTRFNSRIKGLAAFLADNEYTQAVEVMCTKDDAMCASGIACEMYRLNNEDSFWHLQGSYSKSFNIGVREGPQYEGMVYSPPAPVLQWYGVDQMFFEVIAQMNDSECTFEEISDWIYNILEEVDFDEIGYSKVHMYQMVVLPQGDKVNIEDFYGNVIARNLHPEWAATMIAGMSHRDEGSSENMRFEDIYKNIVELEEQGGVWKVYFEEVKSPVR